jgi:hypothetical protein
LYLRAWFADRRLRRLATEVPADAHTEVPQHARTIPLPERSGGRTMDEGAA